MESVNKKAFILKPNQSELKAILRAKYPQSKFNSLYVGDVKRDGEHLIFYHGIGTPYSRFLSEYGIDGDYISTSEHVAPSEISEIVGINRLKNNTIQRLEYCHNSQIVSEYAHKITAPFDVAQSLIRPIKWYEVNQMKCFTPSFQIGCKHFIPNQKNVKGEKTTLKYWIYTVHNYLFPLHHLGDTRRDVRLLENKKHFVFCEGENDVNCFNYHFQDTPFYAVTVGGVSTWKNAVHQKEYLRKLLPTAKWLSLFDNDLAGETEVKDTIRLNCFVGEAKGFDVCDAFQTYTDAKERILSHLEKAIIEKKQVKELTSFTRIKDLVSNESYANMISYKPIVVNKYLDEARFDIVNILKDAKRLYIHGHPELGKTTLFKNLSNDATLLEKLAVKRVIIVTPRVMLATELQKSTNSVIARGKDFSEIECLADNEKLIITNIDNIRKIRNLLSDSLLICDEIHKITSDSPFRDVHNRFLELCKDAPYCVFMSATPDMNICKYLNFSYLHCSSKYRTANKRYNVSYFQTNSYMDSYLSKIKLNLNQRHVVFHDSKQKLEIAQIEIEKMGLRSVIISRETCESVVKIGLENLQNYNVILCTSIADAGIDMKFRVDTVHLQYSMNVNDAVQAIGRGRGDVNFVTSVYCYHSEKTPLAGLRSELVYNTEDGENCKLLFWQNIEKAKNVCIGLNNLLDMKLIKDVAPQFPNSIEKLTYYSEKTEKYEINIAYCSFLANIKPCSLEQHFKELTEIDGAIVLNESQIVVSDSDIEKSVKIALKDKKDFNKMCKEIAKDFIHQDLGNAICFVSQNNNDAKDWLTKHNFDITKKFYPKTENEGEAKTVSMIVFDLMKRFFEISKYAKGYDSTHFVEFSDDAYRLEIRRLVTQYRNGHRNDRLSPKDLQAKERSQKLASELYRMKKNEKCLTEKELKEIVLKIYPIITGSEWLMYAQCVYYISIEKEGIHVLDRVHLERVIKAFEGEKPEKKKTEKPKKPVKI